MALALVQVFIDYNISGMSYVHLRNALFLQPLPELSSVPSSERQPCRDKADPNDVSNPLPLTGIFTASTVPESLVANPLGQGAPGRSPAAASAHQQAAGTTAGKPATARELEPVTLQGDTEEVCWGPSVGYGRECRCAFRSGPVRCCIYLAEDVFHVLPLAACFCCLLLPVSKPSRIEVFLAHRRVTLSVLLTT